MRFCRQFCPLVSESWIRSTIKILDEFILEIDHLEEDFRDRRPYRSLSAIRYGAGRSRYGNSWITADERKSERYVGGME